jgi:hypothetical protein
MLVAQAAAHAAVHLREEGLVRLANPDIVAKANQSRGSCSHSIRISETFSRWRAPERAASSFFVCEIRRPSP